ncbi:MAG: SUMF1/EgtB/PvdO family nonheme iron enzyme [Thiolinea sp.]
MPDTPLPPADQVFLSYSRTNLDAAIAMRSALEQGGIVTFRDEDSIRVGDNWMNRLQTTLQDCSAFVLLIGRDGVQRWVMAETQVALIRHFSPHDAAQRLAVFPVLLPDGDVHSLPPFLSLFQIQRWQPGEALPDTLLQAIRDKTDLPDNRIRFEGCPFLGLGAFQREHAALFFGRSRETLEALEMLGAQQAANPEQMHREGQYNRWLQIEGNSGAGKSSLVNAGMLPLVEQGALWSRTGFEQWKIIGPMMPGEHPLRQLAEVVEHTLVPEAAARDSGQLYRRFQEDEHAFVMRLRDFSASDTAFLLVVDQFEELFTFAEKAEKLQFDLQLYHALRDQDCPLFLISTVRIDFLEGFEQLSCLSELYNRYCKRYLLKTISQAGLREVVEQPARLAGLDVSEITTAILQDAREEPGALPLVENALRVLWEERKGDVLSGQLYADKGGIAGLLEEQADALLQRLDSELNGRGDALELLLALTRVNDEGRHTRRRLPLGEARLAAGGKKADAARGQQIIDYLSGHSANRNGQRRLSGNLRLVSVLNDDEADSGKGATVDLIHETLIRPKGKDAATGKLVGYWKTLYSYIEANRDRGFYRDQLQRQAEDWAGRKGLGRWRKLAGWGELRAYRKLRPEQGSVDARFLRRSRVVGWIKGGVLAGVLTFVGESFLWTVNNSLPVGYMLMQQRFRLMDLGLLDKPFPEMIEKEIQPPVGTFAVGEFDDEFGVMANNSLEQQGALGQQNFGYPATTDATIESAYSIGKYEVSYAEYDYFIWQEGAEKGLQYPAGQPSRNRRGKHAVTNVSWNEANLYLQWLSAERDDGYHYRLPTEAEWEYAARAGTKTPYWWDNREDLEGKVLANCDGCGSQWDKQFVAPVDSFYANDWGLYNTAGNVWEWTCSEWETSFSDGSESRCVEVSETTGQRVFRGGSWNNSSDWLRSSARAWNVTDLRSINVGFRVYRSPRTK